MTQSRHDNGRFAKVPSGAEFGYDPETRQLYKLASQLTPEEAWASQKHFGFHIHLERVPETPLDRPQYVAYWPIYDDVVAGTPWQLDQLVRVLVLLGCVDALICVLLCRLLFALGLIHLGVLGLWGVAAPPFIVWCGTRAYFGRMAARGKAKPVVFRGSKSCWTLDDVMEARRASE